MAVRKRFIAGAKCPSCQAQDTLAMWRENNIDIVEIDEHLSELSYVLKEKIRDGFEDYGLTIEEFYVTNVVLPAISLSIPS